MAAPEIISQQPDRSSKRRPFTSWMKRLANRKNSDTNNNSNTTPKKQGNSMLSSRNRKAHNTANNNPYPASGFIPRTSHRSSEDGASSFATSNAHPTNDTGSVRSEPLAERDGLHHGTRSAAPTVNTKAETLHSDAGHSKAATATTGGGAGAGSTFSSPNQSVRSLSTTLTTIQSTSAGNTLSPNGHSGHTSNPVLFSHQYPVSPISSTYTASAIPRHVSGAHAAASNTLTDDASILTLASSSKRRRRSMDTDASVRAMAPSSVWGGSRESLPLSILSANIDLGLASARPTMGGHANTERASIYSSQGMTSPAIVSDRNSYYAGAQRKEITADTKSLRSINNLDARSQYDAKSITDGKSMDFGSIRGYEGSTRSGAVGHSRQDSIPGSIGGGFTRPTGTGIVSRRSSDWAGHEAHEKGDDSTDQIDARREDHD